MKLTKEKNVENVINIYNISNNYNIGGIVLNNSNKSDKNQWKSPLNITSLNNIFKASTPQCNKNFIFNGENSLNSIKNSNENRNKISGNDFGDFKKTGNFNSSRNIENPLREILSNNKKKDSYKVEK